MSDHTIVIIQVMKIFFVQFFCVFLPSLLNIFCLNLKQSSLVAQRLNHLPAMQETWVQSLAWKYPLEKEMEPTPVLLLGKSHGWRSLVGYSPWDRKESKTLNSKTLKTSNAGEHVQQ